MITLTQQAIEQVRSFQVNDVTTRGKPFRVRVNTGGCSGFTYDFSFDEEQSGDTSVLCGDVRVIVDAESLPILQGATVDYIEDFQGTGFSISNPNSSSSCGCGKSFGV